MIKLLASERLIILDILNQFTGFDKDPVKRIAEMTEMLEDAKKVKLTDEELKIINLKITELGNGQQQWNFDDTKLGEIEINLSEKAIQFTKNVLINKFGLATFLTFNKLSTK